ncbi:MAG: hypothetical protein R3E12_12010 [Candidatus Eisenbacteria bacterium]
MSSEFHDREHLFRAGGLLVVGVVLFLVIRHIFIPDTFGDLGHYRARAIDDAMAREPVFAGQVACGECHDDVLEVKSSGAHRGVHCEACHGALGVHANDPDALTPELPPGRETCLRCHHRNLAKPTSFPAIDPDEHCGDDDCLDCHEAHRPEME